MENSEKVVALPRTESQSHAKEGFLSKMGSQLLTSITSKPLSNDELLQKELASRELKKIKLTTEKERSKKIAEVVSESSNSEEISRELAVRITEILVSKQQNEHLHPRYIFNSIYYDKFHLLQRVLEANPEFIEDTDAVGGSPIHVAYLYEKYDIGRWLVSNFPDQALRPYTNKSTYTELPPEYMPYTGETILHMCIIRRKHDEVRFLLDFYRDRKESVPSCAKRLEAIMKKQQSLNKGQLLSQSEKFEFAVAEASTKKSRFNDDLIDYLNNGLHSLLFSRAVGTFFNINGNFYCGEVS